MFVTWLGKKNNCRHYSISNHKSYSIIEVAKMFNSKINYLKSRPGERFASALTNMNLSNKVYKYFGKISLKEYVKDFIKNNKNEFIILSNSLINLEESGLTKDPNVFSILPFLFIIIL